MNYKTIITYLILLAFGLAIHYISGIYGIFEFILSIFIYTILFYFFHYLWVKIRKKEIMYFPDFVSYFLQRISIFLLIVTSLLGSLAYISNEIYPAPMPEYTITNGEKIVKFQAMSHIGTETFYNQIITNLTEFKNQGGVYFYEGVRAGTNENAEKFNNAIGMDFDEELYKNFSKLYGVVNQDNKDFMGLINDLDFNVDIGMDEIIALYEEKISTKSEDEIYESKIPVDANKEILRVLSELNDKQLKILVYVNQAILNFIIGSDSTQSFLTNNFANKDLFDVILGERNKVLTKEIIKSEYNDIYVTYGLLHFKGVLDLLQAEDEKWQVTNTKKLYPIKK